MNAQAKEDRRLAKLTRICLALPETGREQYGSSHALFRVRKKTFAYFLDNHHGDGKVALVCKVPTGDNADMAAADPARFYLPAYLAVNGWVALRLDVGAIDWELVAELATDSYRLIAPKRLAAQL
jgi:hypothetical protein